MQDGNHADSDAEMSGIGGDGAQWPGGCLEQQIIDEGSVLIRDMGDGCGQGEDDMIIRDRQ